MQIPTYVVPPSFPLPCISNAALLLPLLCIPKITCMPHTKPSPNTLPITPYATIWRSPRRDGKTRVMQKGKVIRQSQKEMTGPADKADLRVRMDFLRVVSGEVGKKATTPHQNVSAPS